MTRAEFDEAKVIHIDREANGGFESVIKLVDFECRNVKENVKGRVLMEKYLSSGLDT